MAVLVGKVHQPRPMVNIRIDRMSPLGNPFRISGQDTREVVCAKYAEYFKTQVQTAGSPVQLEFQRILDIVKSGESVNLQCWCHPKQCHGDTVQRWLEANA